MDFGLFMNPPRFVSAGFLSFNFILFHIFVFLGVLFFFPTLFLFAFDTLVWAYILFNPASNSFKSIGFSGYFFYSKCYLYFIISWSVPSYSENFFLASLILLFLFIEALFSYWILCFNFPSNFRSKFWSIFSCFYCSCWLINFSTFAYCFESYFPEKLWSIKEEILLLSSSDYDSLIPYPEASECSAYSSIYFFAKSFNILFFYFLTTCFIFFLAFYLSVFDESLLSSFFASWIEFDVSITYLTGVGTKLLFLDIGISSKLFLEWDIGIKLSLLFYIDLLLTLEFYPLFREFPKLPLLFYWNKCSWLLNYLSKSSSVLCLK